MKKNINLILGKTTYDEQSKIWRGHTEEILYGPEDSIGSVAIEKMLQHPDHIAQVTNKIMILDFLLIK